MDFNDFTDVVMTGFYFMLGAGLVGAVAVLVIPGSHDGAIVIFSAIAGFSGGVGYACYDLGKRSTR